MTDEPLTGMERAALTFFTVWWHTTLGPLTPRELDITRAAYLAGMRLAVTQGESALASHFERLKTAYETEAAADLEWSRRRDLAALNRAGELNTIGDYERREHIGPDGRIYVSDTPS